MNMLEVGQPTSSFAVMCVLIWKALPGTRVLSISTDFYTAVSNLSLDGIWNTTSADIQLQGHK